MGASPRRQSSDAKKSRWTVASQSLFKVIWCLRCASGPRHDSRQLINFLVPKKKGPGSGTSLLPHSRLVVDPCVQRMHHPVNNCNGWRCPRAILLRRQYRTLITGVTTSNQIDWGTTRAAFPSGPGPPPGYSAPLPLVWHPCSTILYGTGSDIPLPDEVLCYILPSSPLYYRKHSHSRRCGPDRSSQHPNGRQPALLRRTSDALRPPHN